MPLQIYNVLGREKQEFHPITEGHINMYVCGPTVYDHAHIGHAKNYVSFDVIVRYLRYRGYDVLYVQNITDVGHLLDSGEDRILKKARESAATPMKIVEEYARSYFEDMDELGVQRPDISPRASAHIPEQIKMTQTLIDKGHAYEANGSVYFDVRSAPEYGKLSNRQVDQQAAGAREDVRDEKRHPDDFALWKKAAPEHILRWDSPWGVGFPGWHIECSAMAAKYLGETFDIHGGGIDNIFPHNECEIVQSECAHGKTFANYWILVGSLMVPDEFDGTPVKMSKSLGNFVTIKDALSRHPAPVIRNLILSGHYSNPLNFSDDSFTSARNGWERIINAVQRTRKMMRFAPDGEDGNSILPTIDKTRQKFEEAMDDDFNAPAGLAALYELTREVNTLLENDVSKAVLEAIDQTYRDLGETVFGIIPAELDEGGANPEREDALIQMLAEMRSEARKAKDFARSDQIRDELANIGVELKDHPDGTTTWRIN